MTGVARDVERHTRVLSPIDDLARRQRWDDERPWRVATHLWVEDGLVVVDLHDLGAKSAKKLMRAVLDELQVDGMQSGALAFVTGRGRHSSGGPVLRELVGRRLHDAIQDQPAWSMHVIGAGRICLVTDAARAPRKATNSLGWGFWLLLAGLAAAAVWACLGTPGVG